MDDVRDANHRRAQTFGLGNGTLAHLHLRQMMLEESLVARWPKQDNARNVPGAERVYNVAANEPAGACEQDLQSKQTEFSADLAKLV
jgi:hypothetical protein